MGRLVYSVLVLIALTFSPIVAARSQPVTSGLANVAVLPLLNGLAIPMALPVPKVTLDPSLKPRQQKIAPITSDGPPRSVAAIQDSFNYKTDIVENEILLFTNDPATAQAMANRWKGKVVASVNFNEGRIPKVPSMHLISVTSNLADRLALSQDLAAVNPMKRGDLRVSSSDGLQTLAVAARESAKGLQVGLNVVLHPDSIHNRSAHEAADPFVGPDGVSYGNDPFHWPYLMLGSIGHT